MSIQMTLIFGLLVLQMSILTLLLLPFPYSIKKKQMEFYGYLRKSNHFNIGILFLVVLLSMQFFDCLNKLNKDDSSPYFTMQNARSSSMSYDKLATMFYAQRNLYISGAVLYLCLTIFTVTSILRNVVAKETEYRQVISEQSSVDEKDEIDELKSLIEKKQANIDVLAKQIAGLQSSYDALNKEEPRKKND